MNITLSIFEVCQRPYRRDYHLWDNDLPSSLGYFCSILIDRINKDTIRQRLLGMFALHDSAIDTMGFISACRGKKISRILTELVRFPTEDITKEFYSAIYILGRNFKMCRTWHKMILSIN